MTSPGEQRVLAFVAQLDARTGGREPLWLRGEPPGDGLPPVTALTYPDLPEPGLLTAVTYGLSLAQHPDWPPGGRELCVCVRSQDLTWARAVAFLAEDLRGTAPFATGNTVEFGERVSEESAMTAWVVCPPLVLPPEDCSVEVGDGAPVEITGIVPLHPVEREAVERDGLAALWAREWDRYDVRRPPAV